MGAFFPLPHVIFFLATLFLPPGTKSFTTTLDVGRPMTATFTREAGGWHAMSEDGRDGGIWSVKDMTVLEMRDKREAKTDLSEFVKINTNADGKKEASVKGHPVTADLTTSELTLSQSEGGPLSKPVVITYSSDTRSAAAKNDDDEETAPKQKKTPAAQVQAPAAAGGKDFHEQDLKGKDLTGASLDNANFAEATLDHTNLTNASAKNADFKGASFVWLSAPHANFSGADFRETTIFGYFEGADFSGANLEGGEMQHAGLYAAKFRGANLRRTKGWSVSREADFSKADVRGANFRGVDANNMPRFRGALYDEETAWPEGFDPKAAGAILKAGNDAGDNSADAPRKKAETKEDDSKPEED